MKTKARVIFTDGKYPYNVQILRSVNAGEYAYTGIGRFCRTFDEVTAFLHGGVNAIEIVIDDYTITNCTAIAACADRRQAALLITANSSPETVEHIVFGWKLPETMEEYIELRENGVWEPLEDAHKITR